MHPASSLIPDQRAHSIFDLALSEAAAVVESISSNDVHINVLGQGKLSDGAKLELFNSSPVELSVVSQATDNMASGLIYFVMCDQISMPFIRVLLNEQARLKALTELEEEAFLEVGNIVINQCLGHLSDIWKQSSGSELPILSRMGSDTLLNRLSDNSVGVNPFYIEMQISVKDKNFPALLFWPQSSWLNSKA